MVDDEFIKVQSAVLNPEGRVVDLTLEREDGTSKALKFSAEVLLQLAGLSQIAMDIVTGKDNPSSTGQEVTKVVGVHAGPSPDEGLIRIQFTDQYGFDHWMDADPKRSSLLRLQLRRTIGEESE